jgi:hypothetical protein
MFRTEIIYQQTFEENISPYRQRCTKNVRQFASQSRRVYGNTKKNIVYAM